MKYLSSGVTIWSRVILEESVISQPIILNCLEDGSSKLIRNTGPYIKVYLYLCSNAVGTTEYLHFSKTFILISCMELNMEDPK
jgi:hypothetical protein